MTSGVPWKKVLLIGWTTVRSLLVDFDGKLLGKAEA